MDKTLPNGQVITDVPAHYTDEDVKNYALAEGLITPEAYNVDTETGADWYGVAGELGGGVGGAILGAQTGAVFGPIGAALGGIAGGALGTFLGSAAGETAEAVAEDRDVSSDMWANAGEAAVVDAGAGVVFGVAGKILGKTLQPIYRAFTQAPVAGSVEELTHRAALDVTQGRLTAEEAVAKYAIPSEALSKFQQNLAKSEDELLAVEKLFEKLEKRNVKLLPSQSPASTKGMLASQEIGQASLTLGREIDDTIAAQNVFITDSFKEILQASKPLSRQETGAALKNLVDSTSAALKVAVAPLYRNIDIKGGIIIRPAQIGIKLNAFKKSLGAQGKAVTAAESIFKSIPSSAQPKEIAIGIGDLRSLLQNKNIPAGSPVKQYAALAIKDLEKTLKGPQFVQTKALVALGEEAHRLLIDNKGKSAIEGAFASRASKLTQLRPTMSFKEAHEELSNIKKLQRDMDDSLGSKDSRAYALLTNASKVLEEQMRKAANRFEPSLRKEYDAVSKIYREGLETINGDWIVKSLNKSNPALIGEQLVAAGEQVGLDQVRALMAKAKELKATDQGVNLIESIRANYLTALFPSQSAREAELFSQKLRDPRFRDTFEAIVDKGTGKALADLANEVDILRRGLAGSEASASLAVRGREISAATSPSVTKAASYYIVSNAVQKNLSAEQIKQSIAKAKQINSKLRAGETLSDSYLKKVITADFLPPYLVGQVFGASARQSGE
mgnify:FL=1|tara:strand:+ start:1306 stop:3492 length:2187 start_codon:yes stop_codon:yes gene_type:complete